MDFKSVPKPMSKSKGKSKRENRSIKVVYISSPMKVKASASRFRATVQELTGKHSDIATLMMEANDTAISRDFEVAKDEFGKGSNSLLPSVLKHEENSPSDESAVTASSSEDLSTHLVDVFSTTHHHHYHHHHQNVEKEIKFHPDSIFDYSWIDILGSYDII